MSITDLLKPLGPGAKIVYLQQEDDGRWWCEITLPPDRYTVTLVTDWDIDAEGAVATTVSRALLEFRR